MRADPDYSAPLLRALLRHVVPAVERYGMENVIIAHSTWRKMQQSAEELPKGASLTRKPLLSPRTPLDNTRKYGLSRSGVSEHWPLDHLIANNNPIIGFVISGEVALPFGDYRLYCRPGHAYFILPGTPYPDGTQLYTASSGGRESVCSMLSFMGSSHGVECWLNHTYQGKHWSHRTLGENCHVLHPLAQNLLGKLVDEVDTDAPHKRMLCDGLLRALIALLAREIEQMRAFQPQRPSHVMFDAATPTSTGEGNPILYAQEYIRNNLRERISIDSVARYVHMSRAHFTRQFKTTTGLTFSEFVSQRRLESAKVLLQDTRWPIDKISEFVGITPTRLRMLFAEHLNMTPSEFREMAQENEEN